MFMKKLKLSILALCIALSGSLMVAPAFVSADFKTDACSGVTTVAGGSTCTAGSSTAIQRILKFVINILSVIVGFTAVIMVIVAGFKFMTSGGNSNSISSARSTLVYALIGLALVAIARIIVRFTLEHAK